MNIVIAPDSFKESLDASTLAAAMEVGVRQVQPDAHCHTLLVSDGGEGFLEAVARYRSGIQRISKATVDPLGRAKTADFLWQQREKIAYIELAQASGLALLDDEEKNPMYTSTLGTGNQIRQAIALGAKKIYVGLGGSATNDAAIGMAQAYGYQFLDDSGNELAPKGENLIKIHKIVPPTDMSSLPQMIAINDVQNPLYGPKGAAHTYARQKGADDIAIAALDDGLRHLDKVVQEQLGMNAAQIPGTGAAGGTGYGLKVFFKAEFTPGTTFILGLSGFDPLVKQGVDLILTGEGCIDDQTFHGKLIHGILQRVQPLDMPVGAICGKLNLTASDVDRLGLAYVQQLFDPAQPNLDTYGQAESLVIERTVSLMKEFLAS